MEKFPVPQSWKDAASQQQQLREEGTIYKTINKVSLYSSSLFLSILVSDDLILYYTKAETALLIHQYCVQASKV